MTEREQFRGVLKFEEVDRVPNVEIGYWEDALIRWQTEGMPKNIPFWAIPGDHRYTRHSRELLEYFGLDAHDVACNVTISDWPAPNPTEEVIAEDNETRTVRYSHGLVRKFLKSNVGMIHDLEFPVRSHADWERLRKCYYPGWHRISGGSAVTLPPDDRDYAVLVQCPGFYWALRDWLGFEASCTIFYEDPAFAREMLEHHADYLLGQLKLVLEHLDPEYVQFHEDMSYNHGPMLSPKLIEEFLVPQYAKLSSYVNSKGIGIIGIDSDGFNDEMVPILHQAGVNLWAPFEIICREGRDDLLALGDKYPWLRMIGGMDKTALAKGKEAIDAEIAKIRPLVERGGYIPTIDHKVPPETPLEAYRYYLKRKSEALVLG